jgi:hypothetical protein
MCEDDVAPIETRRTGGCDNDIYSADFVSKMDQRFRSPVQSCEAETGIESDASFDPPDAGTGSSTPLVVTCTLLQVPTPEIAEPADAPMVS